MKKIVLGFMLAFAVFSLQTGVQSVFAESGGATGIIPTPTGENSEIGKRIQNGDVHLSDIPIIIIHLIDICTKLAGTIAVIFLLYAGFQMIISGVSDDREAAKNTIKYALTGLIVSFLAWVIVNLVQVQLTS